MSDYIRVKFASGLYFFTLVTFNCQPFLTSPLAVGEAQRNRSRQKRDEAAIWQRRFEDSQAKQVFVEIVKSDKWAEDCDVVPFLAEAYRGIGEVDSAEAAYSNILTLLDDLVFFHPKEPKLAKPTLILEITPPTGDWLSLTR